MHSIVALRVEQKGFVHGAVMVDNSGYAATGKVQGTTFLSVSQLLGLNDVLTASYTKNLGSNHEGGDSKQYAVSYYMPDGNQTYRFSLYKYDYHQLLFMPNEFVASGMTRGQEFTVEASIESDEPL
ncbi:MAG: ShlB/FhaC/HecB family hemolysin secretion/activation protein [Veillonella caviae]|uniref:ShlB/FhaC/HecB family hemolysin secretion/activation protein n=1 Tax=Veillonella caviae TaxID=248316 RepID=UPI002A91DE53|nr:ShlB/FhaC/HecB family hemolysin secretion/activation protein [Veillonella caviae]MDY5481136.1 ShlB/FhaC/HecB family hemolysin secretion/activation protein [Veillonella caviae]